MPGGEYLVSSTEWAERRDHGMLRWQVREWPRMMAWEGEEAQGQREQRTDRTRRGQCPQSCRQHHRPDEGVRRRHRFGSDDAFSSAHAELEMEVAFMTRTT